MRYRGRATSCTQVSFNSRPELIIESYELYISTSEPTSARNNNEVSRVVWVDEQLTHCSLSSAWYETAMMESKVVYCLQKYSWKEPVNGTPDNFSGRFSGNFAGTTDRPECLKRFSVFPVVFLFFKATLDTTLRFSRPFFGKWFWFVHMVNAIPGRHLLALNFAYHLPKPWTEWYVRVNGKQLKKRIGRRQTRDFTTI